MFSLLRSGVPNVVFGMLGKLRLGKLRLGKLSGGRDDKDAVPDMEPVDAIGAVDGKFREGNDNGGMVGTESGGNPGEENEGVETGGTTGRVEAGERVGTAVDSGAGVYDGTEPIVGRAVEVKLGNPVEVVNVGNA